MRVVVTGAQGFVGWHTRLRLHATTDHEVVPVGREEWPRLAELIAKADAVIHIAGVNRGDEGTVETENTALAEDLAAAVHASGRELRVVYANSIQANLGNPYGRGKAAAAASLANSCASTGGSFVDVVLPNLFGEHARPQYNSFVATFAEAIATANEPRIQEREVELLHVQEAANALIAGLTSEVGTYQPRGTSTTVAAVYETLVGQHEIYRTGDLPALDSQHAVELFNTLRARLFRDRPAIPLLPRADERGRLVETVRAHGGAGQTFVSTTRPGVVRGEHFHLRKIERFVVVAGQARISLRRVLTNEQINVDVTGDEPVAVDMPTGWTHSIQNTGPDELLTLFWTNELFNPDDTDTFPELVSAAAP